MIEKLGDQIKIILEKIQKIEKKHDNDLEQLKQQNKELEEKKKKLQTIKQKAVRRNKRIK